MDQRALIIDCDEKRRQFVAETLIPEFSLRWSDTDQWLPDPDDTFRPDVVLVGRSANADEDHYTLCQRLRRRFPSPVAMVSIESSEEIDWSKAYEAGLDDVADLTRPDALRGHLRLTLRRMRPRNGNTTEAAGANGHANASLVERQRFAALGDVAFESLSRFAAARDPGGARHLDHIRVYSGMIADELQRGSPYQAEIDNAFLEELARSAPLHDIGKVAIPDAILLKPGRLTAEEFEIMKGHCKIGASILEEAQDVCQAQGTLEMAIAIARHHHERFDGAGYPDGLSGHDIPLAARIITVADVFDALTSFRVYKDAIDPDTVRVMMRQEKGRRFDPVIFSAFEKLFEEIRTICLEQLDEDHLRLDHLMDRSAVLG